MTDMVSTLAQSDKKPVYRPTAPFMNRIIYGTKLSVVQSWFYQKASFEFWKSYWSPPEQRPDLIKQYDCRPNLLIRIFFPSDYDQTSPQTLPTLFSIHGGGFSIGVPDDDDAWNRTFADTNGALVIALNYWKAPWKPWPNGLHDLEALYLAAVQDESLPIDKSRIAITGFSAGGNLSLCLSQLKSVKEHPTARPSAVLPIYPPVDFVTPPEKKKHRRPYKIGLLPGIRGEQRDFVLSFAPVFDWAYVPYGTNLKDPLLSPAYAERGDLPANVCIVAAELDYLAWEAWDFACKLGGKKVTSATVGRKEVAKTQELETKDERFGWEVSDERGSVKWLLVPDVIHAFDMHEMGANVSDPESIRDGNAKAVKVIKVLGDWLRSTAW
ncbi:alpha beta hydrolase fold protein [Colletotrichum truncatum]|uniref:Alpha beta hydrolase fold protein n=1 Tax=Colletotrichum truncatum TaxID=5467 RepID=A0ACC3YRY7_COLTU|nr:alpha beta hydrolase fold protein [Colletotrichum truncatum]KAF6799317.1 alpha beta hydrolase fold protein [Colletotrichum truncatum]